MGCLKLRVQPEDVIINCSKGVTISPPKGHKWKEVRHDNMVFIIFFKFTSYSLLGSRPWVVIQSL